MTPRAIQHHPSNAKNPDERYREALQRFRADRAEQQQRELVQRIRLSISNEKLSALE